MADIKLTDATWLAYNVGRAKGVLMVPLGSSENKAGITEADLAAMLEYAGLVYTSTELVAIRAALIDDGTIEVV